MQSGKKMSAYALFKAKHSDTPRKDVREKTLKPEATTPIAGLLKHGQGKLKKLRDSARSKKMKRDVKRAESNASQTSITSLPTRKDVDDGGPSKKRGVKRAESNASQTSITRLPTRMDVDDGGPSIVVPSQRRLSKTDDSIKSSGSVDKKRKSPYTTTPEKGKRKKVSQPLQQPGPLAKRLKFQESGVESIGGSHSRSELDNSLSRDSQQHGQDVFSWLMAPFKVQDYFKNIFERKPLLLKRHQPDYYKDIFSSKELHNILIENDIQFSRNIDVTTYTDGKRETHNPSGRAHPQVVWDYYNNGCSVRMLNPQSYSTRVWQVLASLQEFFGCFVGANIYLTPPGSQGFAPHYDDIEAFVVQLEGKKHWKLYNPRSPAEVLPSFSSSNFTDADIGQPLLDTTLEAGDLLYFPRGVIHQASTPSETHSLHITISACQKNTWGDLMEHLLTRALSVVREENIEFRKSLPTDYLNYMGVAHQDLEDERRLPFMKKIGDLFSKLLKSAPVDAAVDQMSLEFVHTSLPPVLEEAEESHSIFGVNASCKDGLVSGFVQLSEESEIRLMRRNILRLVPEDEKVLVYHSVENSRVFKEKELQYFEIPPELAPAVEHLLHTYPDYTPVDSLLDLIEAGENADDPVDLAQTLYEKGLVVTKSQMVPTASSSKGGHREVAIYQSR